MAADFDGLKRPSRHSAHQRQVAVLLVEDIPNDRQRLGMGKPYVQRGDDALNAREPAQ